MWVKENNEEENNEEDRITKKKKDKLASYTFNHVDIQRNEEPMQDKNCLYSKSTLSVVTIPP